jgi:hypothetical protein
MSMEHKYTWNLTTLLQSPLLAPLYPVLHKLNVSDFPSLQDLNKYLAGVQTPLRVQSGRVLHFVPQEKSGLGFEEQYEPRCFLNGEVQTRSENWHDVFNALVWLTYPRAKAAINARHYQVLSQEHVANESQRGLVRDMATLLDESGVIVVCSNANLAALLKSFQWKTLFWQHREQVRAEMDFYIFGHGLYEKALQPYVGMTGQGLVVEVATEFFSWTLPQRLSYLDEKLADYLLQPEHGLSPRALHPVPLLGMPGWSKDNEKAEYYDNTAYFRPGRRRSK